MDRTVPKTGSEEIILYMRTYYSLLRSSHPVQIETLEESHMAMESSLHIKASALEPDVSALVYSSLRLPDCMVDVDLVLIGQIERSFIDDGYTETAECAGHGDALAFEIHNLLLFNVTAIPAIRVAAGIR